MPLSAYDIKRIAAEVIAQQQKELSMRITKAINAAVKDATDEWLTTKQACEFMKMSSRLLQRLREEGRIAYSKPDGRVYYRKSNLISYLDNTGKRYQAPKNDK